MIEKDAAIEIQGHALKACEALTSALNTALGRCSEEDFMLIRRGVGRCLGDIQIDLLAIINSQYPELNDHVDVNSNKGKDKLT